LSAIFLEVFDLSQQNLLTIDVKGDTIFLRALLAKEAKKGKAVNRNRAAFESEFCLLGVVSRTLKTGYSDEQDRLRKSEP